jgi:acetolactate synthase-1/3 small subunit
MKEKYILTILAEKRLGLLSQITGLLNRKMLEIESITAAKTDAHSEVIIGIELFISEKALHPLLMKLENIIEVLKVAAVKVDDVICHRLAFFKLSKGILNTPQSSVIQKHGTQIINLYPDAILISKAGNEKDINVLFQQLDGPHLLGFMQSGLLADTALINADEVRVMEFLQNKQDHWNDVNRISGLAA